MRHINDAVDVEKAITRLEFVLTCAKRMWGDEELAIIEDLVFEAKRVEFQRQERLVNQGVQHT